MIAKMKQAPGWRIVLLLWAWWLAAWPAMPAQSATLRLSGSTTLGSLLTAPLRDAFLRETGVELVVRMNSSAQGLRDLLQGESDLSLSSAPLPLLLDRLGHPPGPPLTSLPLGQDRLVAIVHPTSPLRRLTWEELGHLFSRRGDDTETIPVTGPPGSATRIIFEESVLRGAPLAPHTVIVRQTSLIPTLVARVPGAIGVVSQGLARQGLETVRILETEPLSRPLLVIAPRQKEAEAVRFIAFLKERLPPWVTRSVPP